MKIKPEVESRRVKLVNENREGGGDGGVEKEQIKTTKIFFLQKKEREREKFKRSWMREEKLSKNMRGRERERC